LHNSFAFHGIKPFCTDVQCPNLHHVSHMTVCPALAFPTTSVNYIFDS